MEFSEEKLRKWLSKYKFRDLTIEELKHINELYPNIKFTMSTYTFKDGSQKDLLNFTSTVPVKYKGNIYNIPICIWILDSYPFAPPICFLNPTANMGISVGKHVDVRGRIYLPYLQAWSHPQSVIIGLLQEMSTKFEEELPLYALSSSDEARQMDLLSYITKIVEGENNGQLKGEGNKNDGGLRKVTIVGAGDLGLACILAISAKDVADKVVVLDCSEATVKGGTMDLEIFDLPKVEISRDFSASADSKLVVVTVNSLGNAQSYLEVVQSNVELFRGIIPSIAHYSQDSVMLISSQPVEIMTYVSWKLSGFPKSRVIGIGCNLDSARFQYVITNLLKAQSRSKDNWIIGEQGVNKVAAWSSNSVINHPGDKLTNDQQVLTNRAMEILKGKGQRSWSVGLSIADLTDTILNDKRKIHSVSTMVKGCYNINSEVFLSMPCVLGISGVIEMMKPVEEDNVVEKLQTSATSVSDLQQQLKL
ncbi:PREDICTED: ubiquitin-conjugating enzyme E2 variant 3 [Thamnophis sirtalis]|uniref:Ubiquitin-conjugating enzyme E2 variant 3 n=1 Tax=Thamnophis sirtalis TaxID=35019 RepID=A0A6I9Z2H5_9SAUR|nr:PREDICTED: ubiquitin-conjugating enzyme E2 variant 3 [Thamnophis sirtalis]